MPEISGEKIDGIVDEDEAREVLELRLDVLKSLPTRKQNAAILEELVTLTFTLQNAILKMQKRTTDEIKREAEKSRKENARVRKRVVYTVLASVLISLSSAIVGDNIAINHCFLTKSGNLQHSSLCDTLFPGYNSEVDQQQKILTQFNTLVKQIPENQRSIQRIESEIAELKAELSGRQRR